MPPRRTPTGRSSGRRPSAALQHSVRQRRRSDQAGLIGDIHHIRAQWHRGNLPGNDSWQPPLPEPDNYALRIRARVERPGQPIRTARHALSAAHPLYAQLRSWQGRLKIAKGSEIDALAEAGRSNAGATYRHRRRTSATSTATQPRSLPIGRHERTPLEELIRWRLWDRTGGGLMAELGSHQLDASSIFISAQQPGGRKVQAAVGHGRRRPAHFPGRPRLRRPRVLHVRVPRPRLLQERRRHEVADHEQEDRRHLFVDQRQRLRRLRRDRDGHQGHADSGTGARRDALQRLGHNHADRSEGKPATGPAMDTYETGGGAAVAQAAGGRPKSAAATAKRSSTGRGAFATRRRSTSRAARRKSRWPMR